MLTRVLDYYDGFRCLAAACPHTCCADWEVVVDEDSARRYASVPGELGARLRAALDTDEDGDWCFARHGGRCPFLATDGLCDIHRQLGEAATSVTCREHPRFVEEYGPFREITLSASCPEACRLLLADTAPLTILERTEPGEMEPGDALLEPLAAVRSRLLALLTNRQVPLRTRLAQVLTLADGAQMLLDTGRETELAALAETWAPAAAPGAGPGLFPGVLTLLASLEQLDEDWMALLNTSGTPPVTLWTEAAPALERVAVYVLFHHVLKAVNDGDLLSRVQLAVLAVVIAARLAEGCGLAEGLRRFSREIEHSEDNLERLYDAFRRGAPGLDAFLTELSL